MPLLGLRLLVLVGVLALAGPALALVTWNRVRGPRPLQVAQRLALVGFCQLTALVLGGVALNNRFDFYASWSDLLGTGASGVPAAQHAFGDVSRSPLAHVRLGSLTFANQVGGPPSRHLAGRVVWAQLAGPTTGLSEHAGIYLPPAYQQGVRNLPVVEVFSGFPGTPTALVHNLHYPLELERALSRHAAVPMVLVLLKPGVTAPRDTECTNVPNGPQALDYFANDVLHVVRARFGLTSSLAATVGVSTGGYCAAKLAMLRPDAFVGGVVFSGYFKAIADATTGDLWGGSHEYRQRNDLLWRLRHLPPPPAQLFIGTSRQETGADGYASAQRFLSLVRSPMVADEFVVPTGGHNYGTWQRMVPASITWLSALFVRRSGA